MSDKRTPRSMSILPLIALLGTVAGPAAAQQPNCDNPMSQVEMTYCSGLEFERADRRLNQVYRKVIAEQTRDPGEAPYDARSWEEAMRKAQRAWVAFRDADCKGLVARDWTGGTGTSMAVNMCMTALTRRRIETLEQRYGAR